MTRRAPGILIVDDDADLRQSLSEMFAAAAYEVRAAPNGKVAMHQMRERPADLVITDMIMPEMDGVETILALRRDHPHTKIIAVSGGGIASANSYLNVAKALGAQQVMLKPFTHSEMLATVQAVLPSV